MKLDWKKTEKALYIPKGTPELVTVPTFGFYTISGQGHPASDAFAEAVGLLYALSYGVKMLPRQGVTPEGYAEYAIYPLEGVWDLSEEAKAAGRFDKNDLVYKLMIRQPDFVTDELAAEVIRRTGKKKKAPRLADAAFERIADGLCVQMLHLGSYDEEPASFAQLQGYCDANGLVRTSRTHREIYLTDARKTPSEKQRTTLRIFVRRS